MMLALFERGVFLNPMGTKLSPSVAHDREACEDFLECFADSLAAID